MSRKGRVSGFGGMDSLRSFMSSCVEVFTENLEVGEGRGIYSNAGFQETTSCISCQTREE